MKLKIYFHICRILPVLLISTILSIAGCGGNSSLCKRLDIAESLMECRPDSALAVLDLIDASDLNGKIQKARYGLLKSMALDKNYVDTTVFDVLQPAIDYYLENGTPDEKLRTYYYQGRIYQNRNDRDSALRSFMRGLDIADACKDSLTIARMLVAQGILYKSFYDVNGYAHNYLRASYILDTYHKVDLQLECLVNALNGMIILNDKTKADSIINIILKIDSIDGDQRGNVEMCRLAYTLQFGNQEDIINIINNNKVQLLCNTNGLLDIALAYQRIGDVKKAIELYEYIDQNTEVGYDTLKYLSIKYRILEDAGNYQEALSVYKNCINQLETINSTKFEQQSKSMEDTHRMELLSERKEREHLKIIWGCVAGIVFLTMGIIILILIERRNRIKKDLALQKARLAEFENDKLKAEKENLTLENRNLQLERDNKALEAENLAHRVESLENESDDLKELLQSQAEMPDEVRKAIKTRIEMLNSYLASQISDHKEFEKTYDTWVVELTANKEEFMDSNRLAFQASHPAFIKYFEDHGLTDSEINYVCLYAIGLRGKDVGNYMKMRSHVNISSAIRKKLGIDRHETNIGIYVRKLLKDL